MQASQQDQGQGRDAITPVRTQGTAAAATRSHDAALVALLSITSDAVLAFDEAGTVVLANEEALRVLSPAPVGLWGAADRDLVGMDVRTLFPPAVGFAPQTPFAPADLPFPLDGSTTRLMRGSGDGHASTLVIRCVSAGAEGGAEGIYLLVAHQDTDAPREHERLVSELSRANRRLAGTLDIVLGTLDSPSVGTLFERVLEELCTTMDATGSAVYLAERDGFHLRGTSASLVGVRVPRYMPLNRSFVGLIVRTDHTLRLRVLPPQGESLRKGRLTHRTVMDEDTRETYKVRSSQLPPFASFMAVPVRFGGQVIALIEVGWERARALQRDDADLLDAVTRYLAVQLVGAFAAMRTQRREQLSMRANDLRDALVAEPFSSEASDALLAGIERDLDCSCALVRGSAEDGSVTVCLPVSQEEARVPDALLPADEGVTALLPDAPLALWLAERGEPCLGALVDGGEVDGERVRFLVLRPADAEPLDDLELEYLRQVAETIRALSTGERGRRQDHRISQALQTGMRSQLQKVAGISSQGIYSSATEAAFVGGDFYDLIALPEGKACVIMGAVSGKGVAAASVSAAVRTALGAYSWEGLAPARMVELLNEFLLGFSRLETFATLFVGIVDLPAARLTYCSAGHPPAVMVKAQGGELMWLGVQSGVVGAFHDMRYRDGSVDLSAGDILLLYTDGTTEARARDGAFFGEEGLRDAVLREVPEGFDGLLDRLLAEVDAFTGNSLDDDVAMVALRFDAVGLPESAGGLDGTGLAAEEA